jgi:LmbE family N-acetylglucosaminyl deacetylase
MPSPTSLPPQEEPRPSPLPLGEVPDGPVRSTDRPTPGAALVVAAHPDDAEFHCGATLAKWAAAGATINHLVLTDGSKGTWDPDADTTELVQQRQREQLDAAGLLGSTGKVVMLDHVDGELEPSLAVRAEVAHWIRMIRPDVVLAHDPWKRYRLHPDHRNAGWLAIDGVVAARDPHFFPDDDAPAHRTGAIWLFEAEEPDHVEDVEGSVEAKVAALLAHRSQYRTTHGIPDADDGTAAEAFRREVLARTARVGERGGVAAGEAFKVLDEL